ncbi:ABC transporter ATP-binding protein [Pseudomonas sp. JV551A1]|uniref:ABC transporter ATP-binding protein n=1 Tax=Pseudomonas inefficax TaxID=2078786 RepID=A0AAQ1P7R4_9PSED|nr:MULTISPECIES: type I secretion system permease/ATPase [Pseudomonas]SPO55451.1 ABC transporter ATP-binding protein [Pseudomonas sp. JV551A1]SPO61387.1 ABC transporter ATP-binding protein [Pseudomonas inefficax]
MEVEQSPDNVVPLNHDDPLRQGLLLLCRQLGRPLGDAELVDGLALEHGRLPLRLVVRALRRADITAKVAELPLRQMDAYLLPALLLLGDGRSLLLVGIEGEQYEVLVPQSEGGRECMVLPALEALYSGTAVFAKCRYRPDGRVGDYASGLPEHWFFGPLKRLWRSYAEVTAAALVANVLAVASALFAMQVYDRVVPNAAFDTLWILASGVALAIIVDGVLRILRGHLLNVLGKRLDLQLSSLLFARVLSTRIAAKPASMGAFSTQVREFESVREFFTSSSAALISDLPFVAIFLSIIAVIGGHVVWVPLVACVLMLLPGLLTQRLLGHLSRQNLREGAMKNSVLLEAFEHLETVKATRAEGRCRQQWEMLTGELAGTAMKTHALASTLSYSASIVQQLCYVGVVVFGVYRISDGAMTVGALVACSILASRAIAPLSQAAAILGRWQHTKVALEGLDQLMSAEQERPAGKRFVHRDRLHGHYRLEALRLAHGDSPPVVDVQALSIQAGERVALLGGNGAGKSTLLRLLSGLLDAQSGRLLLDDIALSQIDPADRQRGIGYLPQDVALFHGSLRENLNLANAALGDEELLDALDGVGLGTFVRAHPLGLDMPILGNASLSGGQRQALGLARVLLQDPPILLLDEPTAAFDQNSEKQVIDYLQKWLGRRTLILTTHKKSVLALVDRAVVLRNGQVIMDGPLNQVVLGNQVQAPQVAEGAGHGS